MDKLSKKEINEVKEVLTDFIQKTAGEEDSTKLHTEAMKLMGAKFADKPALIKQAATAYNSNKSMFKLSNEDTANTDFGLLSPDKLYQELVQGNVNKAFEKSASAKAVVTFGKVQNPIQKVASAPVMEKAAEAPEQLSYLQLENYIKDTISDSVTVLNKMASRKDICSYEELNARERFCRSFKFLSKEAKAKVAKHLVDTYREEGQRLLDIYNETADCFDKVASCQPSKSYKSFPKGDIYTQAEDAICAHYVEKQANDALENACSEYVDSLKTLPGLYLMNKKAAGVLSVMAGATMAKPLTSTVFPDAPDKMDTYDDILSRKLLNELREIEIRNVLVDMYSEPFIASYPTEDIQAATIKAVQMLPVKQRKHPRRHVTLLKTWVSDILGRGGNLSAADTDKMLNAEEKLSKSFNDDPVNLRTELY